MNDVPLPRVRVSSVRYPSSLRLQDILVLQGPPLMGVAFAICHAGLAGQLGRLALLMAGNLCLVTHIFMLNDWAGLHADLADPNKAAGVFTARGLGQRKIAGFTMALLVLSLLLFAPLGGITAGLAVAIATLSALYSLPQFDWKGRPLLNSAAHLAGGALHFLLGYSLGSVDGRGIALAMFFALVFAAGHLTQEIRDCEGDAANGIRTNAVTFGPRRTFATSLVLFTIAHVLLLLLVCRRMFPGPLALVGLLYPIQLYWSLLTLRKGLNFASVRRLQSRYRVLYAIAGIVMVAVLCAPLRTFFESHRSFEASGSIGGLTRRARR